MSFTVTRKLEEVPSYSMLCKLAEQNHVQVTGNDRAGSFSCRGVDGSYEFGEKGFHGKFAGRGVTGEFSFVIGAAAITISHKPFWLPETLVKRKIAEGLEKFCSETGSKLSAAGEPL